ncbi:MAG: type II toxin-antitoxin system RelE/ParE family toxin [Thiohalomonadales bacterium]
MTGNGRKKVLAVFYRSKSGNEPVREWLLKLTKENRRAIGGDIQTVEFGWPIGDGLYEVRIDLDNKRIARVLFFFKNGKMVLLHGFIKKAKKTPKPDLDLAKKRRKEVDNG